MAVGFDRAGKEGGTRAQARHYSGAAAPVVAVAADVVAVVDPALCLVEQVQGAAESNLSAALVQSHCTTHQAAALGI
jgi:hypothetical protein